jgi:hypothetical protein
MQRRSCTKWGLSYDLIIRRPALASAIASVSVTRTFTFPCVYLVYTRTRISVIVVWIGGIRESLCNRGDKMWRPEPCALASYRKNTDMTKGRLRPGMRIPAYARI